MKKTAFITDFDGTITKVDFFQMVTEQLLTPAAMRPWDDYVAGRITHIEALNRIFANIHITQTQMDAFISTIEVDRAFYKVLPLLKEKDIPIYVCSAGSAYYIRKRIGKYIKDYNIMLLANGGTYSKEEGLKLLPPQQDNPFYSKGTGVSKEALVLALKSNGYFTVYAGDGRPDLKAAKAADIVFAKSVLLELCHEHKIPTLKFDSFKDIYSFFSSGNYL